MRPAGGERFPAQTFGPHRTPPRPAGISLRRAVESPPLVLQTAGRRYHDVPASPLVGDVCEPVGPLRSTGITPLRRYYGPIRHPLGVRPLPRVTGYSLDMAPPLSRWGEEGFSSCSTCPRHRAVAITPPECPAASARCDGPCCLRLSTVRLGLRIFGMSGPPVRSLPLRPGDSLTILSMASSVGFRVLVSLHPATRVTGLWLLPRRG